MTVMGRCHTMTMQIERTLRRFRKLLASVCLVLTVLGGANDVARGDEKTLSANPRTRPGLGIGFLWTLQSQKVVDKLTSAADFVDVILDPGKSDVFEKVKPPVRVACIALALEKNDARPFPGIKETIETLRQQDVAPQRVIIAYNPERAPGTPSAEMDDLVASARRARQMAQAYGAPLLIGPGLKEMMQREHLYPELAKHCDMWLIQSQRLQLDLATRKPVDPAEYRVNVKRIVDSLRQGNPNIRVFVQVVTTAERGTKVLTAEQIAAFARAVEDIVDAVRIYGASEPLLSQIIDRLRGPESTDVPSMPN
jgi:lysophospholipase L1-like esterase